MSDKHVQNNSGGVVNKRANTYKHQPTLHSSTARELEKANKTKPTPNILCKMLHNLSCDLQFYELFMLYFIHHILTTV